MHDQSPKYSCVHFRDIKLKQTEEIEHLRTKFEEQAREMDIRYQDRFSQLRLVVSTLDFVYEFLLVIKIMI